MSERIQKPRKEIIEPGPVITISRECGCSGRILAEKLTNKINESISDPEKRWKWVSKEILSLAAEELRIHPDEIRKLVNSEDKNFLNEIVSSFADKYYVNDSKIKMVIEEVVRNIAARGKVVIVGRGSEALTKYISRSLHIRLFAPLQWRIETMSKRTDLSLIEAKKIVTKIDQERIKFKETYLGRDMDVTAYDIAFNCATVTTDQIVELILKTADFKSLI